MSFIPNLIKDTKLTNLTMKNTQIFPQTLNSAVKLLNYKNIAPAPTPPSATMNAEYKNIAPAPKLTSEGIKNRKYMPRGINVAANNHHRTSNSSGGGGGGGGAPYNVDQTQSVQRRNARERNRVKQVNNSFARLRQHLPKEIVTELTKGGGRGPQKKISKVDTLRIAVEYIRRLEDYVEDLGGSELGLSATSSRTTTPTLPMLQQSQSQLQLQSPVYNNNNSAQITQEFMHQQNLSPQLPTQLQQQYHNTSLLTPVSLAAFSTLQTTKVDISCHSPTDSYISNTSIDSGTYEPAQQLSPEPAYGGEISTGNHANLALKFEPYEHFRVDEEDCTPDDDEIIIDYISLWQEEQQRATHN